MTLKNFEIYLFSFIYLYFILSSFVVYKKQKQLNTNWKAIYISIAGIWFCVVHLILFPQQNFFLPTLITIFSIQTVFIAKKLI